MHWTTRIQHGKAQSSGRAHTAKWPWDEQLYGCNEEEGEREREAKVHPSNDTWYSIRHALVKMSESSRCEKRKPKKGHTEDAKTCPKSEAKDLRSGLSEGSAGSRRETRARHRDREGKKRPSTSRAWRPSRPPACCRYRRPTARVRAEAVASTLAGSSDSWARAEGLP